MNEKFFKLPLEKQQAIINAAYKVFSENSYKKAPMSEIAEAADISKALLFHYFINKKELYLYLCEHAKLLTEVSVEEYEVYKATELFEMMHRKMQARCSLMRKFPHICAFLLKAYYETTPDIKAVVHAVFTKENEEGIQAAIKNFNTSKLRRDIDTTVMYQNIKLTCEGYLFNMYCTSIIDIHQIEEDFEILLAHWKKVYQEDNIE